VVVVLCVCHSGVMYLCGKGASCRQSRVCGMRESHHIDVLSLAISLLGNQMSTLCGSDSETSVDPSARTDDTSRCVLFSLADKDSQFLSDTRDLVSHFQDLQGVQAFTQ
jgi:hypothetical protein